MYIPLPQKKYTQHNQKIGNARRSREQYFPGFIASFIDSIQNNRDAKASAVNTKEEKEGIYYSGKKKRNIYSIKNQIVVNNHGIIIQRAGYKKESRDMTMTFIKTIILFYSQTNYKCV